MRTTTINRNNAGMTADQLRTVAPSIFATQPWHGMSDRYAFIPTVDVVNKLQAEGFVPVSAVQSRTRIAGKGDFTKHQIRFRDIRNGSPMTRQLGQVNAEIVLTNSHDGASAYKVEAGLFRLVCLNGMVVADGTVAPINVRHSGDALAVIDATFEVVEEMPKALASIEQFQRLALPEPARMAYASAALQLKYEDAAPITAAQLLRPNRTADQGNSLWNTYNVVQEHLVNGGDRGRTVGTGRRLRTRPVSGIAENTRLNKALWTLTEEMRKLAS
jgi:Domain of unknown function (DUF932)